MEGRSHEIKSLLFADSRFNRGRGAVSEVKIGPVTAPRLAATAADLPPSAEVATASQTSPGTLFESQVDPELVEVQIWPLPALPELAAAINLAPSAEQAIERQPLVGALVRVQAVTELVETRIPPPRMVAAMVVPSAEQATPVQ